MIDIDGFVVDESVKLVKCILFQNCFMIIKNYISDTK